MTAARIRVGIVGTTPLRGWAKTAHIPALCALDEYEITAVAASREESAREVAAELGIGHALTDPRRLAALPDVDLVVVTVKVPAHDELVRAALDAGKSVGTEPPPSTTPGRAAASDPTARGETPGRSRGRLPRPVRQSRSATSRRAAGRTPCR